MSSNQFRIGKVFQKNLMLEFLIYLSQGQCFQTLFSTSKSSRRFLFSYFKIFLKRLCHITLVLFYDQPCHFQKIIDYQGYTIRIELITDSIKEYLEFSKLLDSKKELIKHKTIIIEQLIVKQLTKFTNELDVAYFINEVNERKIKSLSLKLSQHQQERTLDDFYDSFSEFHFDMFTSLQELTIDDVFIKLMMEDPQQFSFENNQTILKIKLDLHQEFLKDLTDLSPQLETFMGISSLRQLSLNILDVSRDQYGIFYTSILKLRDKLLAKQSLVIIMDSGYINKNQLEAIIECKQLFYLDIVQIEYCTILLNEFWEHDDRFQAILSIIPLIKQSEIRISSMHHKEASQIIKYAYQQPIRARSLQVSLDEGYSSYIFLIQTLAQISKHIETLNLDCSKALTLEHKEKYKLIEDNLHLFENLNFKNLTEVRIRNPTEVVVNFFQKIKNPLPVKTLQIKAFDSQFLNEFFQVLDQSKVKSATIIFSFCQKNAQNIFKTLSGCFNLEQLEIQIENHNEGQFELGEIQEFAKLTQIIIHEQSALFFIQNSEQIKQMLTKLKNQEKLKFTMKIKSVNKHKERFIPLIQDFVQYCQTEHLVKYIDNLNAYTFEICLENKATPPP